MKFNIEAYRNGHFAMHCKTEAEARDFCNYLHSIGRRWSTGASYLEETNYRYYGNNTCYNVNSGCYCGMNYYLREGFQILEWSDFMNESPIKRTKPFKKANLKTGDIVLHRNGTVSVFIREFGAFIGFGSASYILDNLTDNLTDKNGAAYLDIVAIRRHASAKACNFSAFEYGYGTLVYERE